MKLVHKRNEAIMKAKAKQLKEEEKKRDEDNKRKMAE